MKIAAMKNNTDQFQREQFPPHGRVEMHLSGKTILLKACGPFNLELISALASLEADFLSRHAAQGPFAEIVTFSGSVLASPEVLAAHAQLLVMLKQAGSGAYRHCLCHSQGSRGRALYCADRKSKLCSARLALSAI